MLNLIAKKKEFWVRIISLSVIGTALMPAANVVSAADLRRNDVELGFSLRASDDDRDDAQEIDLEARFGWMLTNTHEVGIVVDWTYVDTDAGSNDFSGGNAGIFYTYNFATLSLSTVPFVGIQTLAPIGDSGDTDDWSWKTNLGMRFLPTTYTSFNTSLFYEQTYTDDNSDPDEYGIEAGISFFF